MSFEEIVHYVRDRLLPHFPLRRQLRACPE